MVVMVIGYMLFVTSQYNVIFRLATNILAKFVDKHAYLGDAIALVGQGE